MCVWCVGRGSAPLITHVLGLSFALLVSEGVCVWCVGRGSAPLITHVLGLSFALLVSEGVCVWCVGRGKCSTHYTCPRTQLCSTGE